MGSRPAEEGSSFGAIITIVLIVAGVIGGLAFYGKRKQG